MNCYNHLRKEISMKLKEIDLACDYKEKKKNVLLKHKKSTKGRNSYGNISLTKKPPTNSNIFLHASGTIANTTNNIFKILNFLIFTPFNTSLFFICRNRYFFFTS